jgi:DivIVA domain-containing protein
LVTILLIVVALVVVTAVAVFAVGDSGRLRADEPDREPADLPDDRGLAAADVDRVRFALGVRGYRMDQVDDVLDRFAAELTRRDQYEAALVEQVRGFGGEPVAQPAVVLATPAESEDDAEPAPVAVEPVSPDAGEHG